MLQRTIHRFRNIKIQTTRHLKSINVEKTKTRKYSITQLKILVLYVFSYGTQSENNEILFCHPCGIIIRSK